MSKLMDELVKKKEILENKKDEESKKELKDIGDFIYALKYVINSGEPIKDLDEKEFYEFLNKVEETKDSAFIEFADLYFERIKFLITDARKYATKEEIDECIEEEINNRKIV